MRVAGRGGAKRSSGHAELSRELHASPRRILRAAALTIAAVLYVAVWAIPPSPGTLAAKWPCRYTAVVKAKVRKLNGDWGGYAKPKVAHKRLHKRMATARDRGKGLTSIKYRTFHSERPLSYYDSESRVRELIGCLAPHFGVDHTKAEAVCDCESGFDRLAYNASGCGGAGCLGLFQHHAAYWDSRAAAYGLPGADWRDAYAQVWVTFSMVRDGGWDAWACS